MLSGFRIRRLPPTAVRYGEDAGQAAPRKRSPLQLDPKSPAAAKVLTPVRPSRTISDSAIAAPAWVLSGAPGPVISRSHWPYDTERTSRRGVTARASEKPRNQRSLAGQA